MTYFPKKTYLRGKLANGCEGILGSRPAKWSEYDRDDRKRFHRENERRKRQHLPPMSKP